MNEKIIIVLTQAEYDFQTAVQFLDETKIPSDAFFVSDEVILTATGFYKPFKKHSFVEDKRTENFNDFISSKNIVICQPIFELLRRKLYPDRHPLPFWHGSTFHKNTEIIFHGDLSQDKVPELTPFGEYNKRLNQCRREAIELLNRNNVYIPGRYKVSIQERWQILQIENPLMVEDALRLVSRGVMCNTHAQYLVESHSRGLPVLSSNFREVILAAEMLGIGYRRTLYGGDLIYCYKP